MLNSEWRPNDGNGLISIDVWEVLGFLIKLFLKNSIHYKLNHNSLEYAIYISKRFETQKVIGHQCNKIKRASLIFTRMLFQYINSSLTDFLLAQLIVPPEDT